MNTLVIVVLVTASNTKEAKSLAQAVLTRKLAACVNIVRGIESLFWWQGRIDSAKESLLIIKTTQRNFKALAKTIKELHSYTNPEIIAMPVIAGSNDYLAWVKSSVRKGSL